MPGLNLDRPVSQIHTLPRRIWLTPAQRPASLKQVPILTGGSSFPWLWWRGFAVELAIAFEAHKSIEMKALAGNHKRSRRVPAIRQHAAACWKSGDQAFQLFYRHCDRRLSAADPALGKNGSPTAGRVGQEHHRRKLPSRTDWPFRVRQIGQVDDATIRAGFGLGARYAGAIHTHPDRSLMLLEQDRCPELAPTSLIDPSVFQSFIDTAPLAAKHWRERQLGKCSGCWLTAQGIYQLKKRISTLLKTAGCLMTNLFPCVKVQSVNVLCLRDFFAKHFTSSGSFWQSEAACCLP